MCHQVSADLILAGEIVERDFCQPRGLYRAQGDNDFSVVRQLNVAFGRCDGCHSTAAVVHAFDMAIGHDHQSREIRTFAVDRILSLGATSKTFEIDPDFDFEVLISSAFGVISETPVPVRIRFDASWRTHVQEHTWHPSQKVSELPDGGIELFMEVGGSTELRNWVMSFGAGAEVMEPKSLREDVIAEARAIGERYKGA